MLSLAALVLALLGSVAWAKPKVAILGLEAANSGTVDPKDAQNAAKLTEELRRIPRGGVGKFDFAANSARELQDEKLMGNCDTEKPACMAPIGTGLSADFLVYGRIEKASDKGKDGYRVTIKILNVKAKALETDKTSESFVPMGTLVSPEALEEWAQKAYAKLSGEKPAVITAGTGGAGKLTVSSNVKDGDVFIGAAKKGRLEDGKLTLSLPEGTHMLAIEAPGHKRYELEVTVSGGKTKVVEAELETVLGGGPPPPPPPGGSRPGGGYRVLTWSAAGLALVGGAVWYYGYKKVDEAEFEICTGRHKGRLDSSLGECANPRALQDAGMPVPDATVKEFEDYDKQGKDWQTRTYIAGGVTIAAAALATYAFVRGYIMVGGSAKEKQAEAAGRTRRKLMVTPVVSPEGGGATVRFDW